MKHLIFINIALILLSSNALAQTINVGDISNIHVADSFDSSTGSSNSTACESSQNATNCDFEQTFHEGTYISNTLLKDLVTSDFSTSVKSPVESNAFIDLSFTNSMYGGAGNDLVLFFVGNNTSFGLDVFGKNINNPISTDIYTITTGDTVFNDDAEGTWVCINGTDDLCTGGSPLSAVFIDLGSSFNGVEIDKLHLTFGNEFNGLDSSNFSLAGGFHSSAMVVPLPLPIILFSSGLALLGWVGRRRAA